MTDCPTCGGLISEMACNGCGKVFRTSDLLGKFPPTEKVARVQAEREDLALREGGG